MNERIKDLARLAQNATATHFGDRWTSIGRAEFMMIYNQKFAELLVKECAYLVNDQQRTTGYTTHAQMLCREFGIEYRAEDYYGDTH